MSKVLSALIFSLFYRMTFSDCNYFGDSNSASYEPTDTCIGYGGTISNSSTMYACSADGTYVTYMAYTTSDCTGDAYYAVNYTSSDSGYTFMCTGMDCAIVERVIEYSTTDCSTIYYWTDVGYVGNTCYSGYMYCCSDDSLTITSYTDSSCSGDSTSYSTDSSCVAYSSYSEKTTIHMCADGATCSGSSAHPAFSAFISFVVVAIAALAC
jgi:hypothetical protein